MAPDLNAPATGGEVEASAEATIAAAAVTLETLQEAIEAEAEVSEERQSELLTEVRECRTKLETLSASIVGVESPAMQQMLAQMGQLQASLERMQTDLAALTSGITEEENGEEAESAEDVHPSEKSPPNKSPSSEKEPADTGRSEKPNNESSSPPESNQSATPPQPRKRRYVKI